jgi:hypothetical protein
MHKSNQYYERNFTKPGFINVDHDSALLFKMQVYKKLLQTPQTNLDFAFPKLSNN